MVIVLGIIALLMLIIVPNLNAQRENAGKKQDAALETVIKNQAEMYANDHDVKVSDGSVNYKNLEEGKYITDKQAARANKLKIELPSAKHE